MEQAQNQSILGGAAMREKYWHERSADEKCQALGEVVAHLLRQVNDLRRVVKLLETHSHNPATGELAVALIPSDRGPDYNPTRHYIDKVGQGPPRE